MMWVVRTLMNPAARPLPYLAAGFVAATLPAALISIILTRILPPHMSEAVESAIGFGSLPQGALLFGAVVVAPIIETLIMVAIIFAARSLGAGPAVQIGIVSLLAALAHGMQAFAWAFAPAWLFFVFALIFIVQRDNGWLRAAAFAAGVHILNNAVAVAPIFLIEPPH